LPTDEKVLPLGSSFHRERVKLEQKIRSKNATVGIVGLGYVGLPLAVEYASKGFTTIGIDIDRARVEAVNAGANYIGDVDERRLRAAVRKGRLRAVDSYDPVGSLDVLFICVPTPFTPNKEPDISSILTAGTEISTRLRKGQLVVLKSTTFPNTTEGYLLPLLEKSKLTVGKDFYLAFSPERIDPGNKHWTTANTPIVVGGVTSECTRLACLISQQVVAKVIPVSSPRVAELEKLLENIFRSVNIALVNELAQLCDRMGGVNVWEVVSAAATKPFGFMPFYPGPGIGGHCILVDPYYLAWAARQYDFQTKFITLAAETNESMPFYVKNLVQREISMMPVTLAEAKILVLGVAFKRDVDDTRHSPALKVMELLLADGARNLMYNDPFVARVNVDGKELRSQPLTASLLKSADCVLITTDHSSYDYRMIVSHAKRVIDTRNATKDLTKYRERIVLLGSRERKMLS
jgi:UDP-N-acetyl-D-glucosamine dehydrogenase